MLRRGLIDYLETLRMAGLEDWGPFEPPLRRETGVRETRPLAQAAVPVQAAVGVPPSASPVVPPPPSMPKKAASAVPAVSSSGKRDPVAAQAALDVIAAEVARCKRCVDLVVKRTQTVFGTGSPVARLMFIGEAPGAEEDKQGIPFVGRAGQLLTDMITKGMGLAREDVYICNILRCRPPDNRNPLPDEAERCRGFLERTIATVAPAFICCLGTIAAQNLLQTGETIGRMRGRVLDYNGIPVVCTYHPAFLLRKSDAKKDTWADLQILMKIMGLPLPKKEK